MTIIKKISYSKVINSHVGFTNEFIVELENGDIGRAAPPQGETISIYEDKKFLVDPEIIIEKMNSDGILGRYLDQEVFDEYLDHNILVFGRNNVYGLSEAFFNACMESTSFFDLLKIQKRILNPPRLCLNILNGGWHAYTNPVLSDFSEFMLVAKSDNVYEVIQEHNEIQKAVREKQLTQEKTVVSGNTVNCFSTRDNREVIEFLLKIVGDLNLSEKYELMIDASASDLWQNRQYEFGVTDGSIFTSEQLGEYWLDIIHQYSLRFLEDPFHEMDYPGWNHLTTEQKQCYVIGDNLYSSSEQRILEGSKENYANGAVIKPNQAGTITAVCKALEAAKNTGQITITSHRSISTESTFTSLLSCALGAQYIKIGPLMTDYSSVVRLNEIIRLTEEK